MFFFQKETIVFKLWFQCIIISTTAGIHEEGKRYKRAGEVGKAKSNFM